MILSVLVLTWIELIGVCGAQELSSKQAPSLQAIVELEKTALLLAILFDSGRSVINENLSPRHPSQQTPIGLKPDVFEQQLVETFRIRAGLDLRELKSTDLSRNAKQQLRMLFTISTQVIADAQSDLHRPEMSVTQLIPVVFGSRVAERFTRATGIRLKQTALAPRNPIHTPDSFEHAALQTFADPSYPREQVLSEVTSKGRLLRLLYPLYATRRCLDCHGEPKGELDITGYPKEGLRFGQNAGAISVVMPVTNP